MGVALSYWKQLERQRPNNLTQSSRRQTIRGFTVDLSGKLSAIFVKQQTANDSLKNTTSFQYVCFCRYEFQTANKVF